MKRKRRQHFPLLRIVISFLPRPSLPLPSPCHPSLFPPSSKLSSRAPLALCPPTPASQRAAEPSRSSPADGGAKGHGSG
eukprot:1647811-Pyramimonas_sp.AAC.1